MFKKSICVILAVSATVLCKPEAFPKIGSTLKNKLGKDLCVNIFVTFGKGTSGALEAIAASVFNNREDRLVALHSALEENASASQKNVKAILNESRESYVVLWITNQVYVREADTNLIINLSQLPEVSEITEEAIISLDDPTPRSLIIQEVPTFTQWGIQKVQAEEAQQLLKNATTFTSEIRIATIDTGVRGTHFALRDNYLGTYGWYDPYKKTELPNDQDGHGTHTTGTISGKGGIGVYPDSKWIGCKGCATSTCAQFALLECGQFVTCPTLPDRSAPDCTKAPHLVNNSWGGGRGSTWFDGVIDAWHVAGIIPIFSIGNAGPACYSAKSPGDNRHVIGVGSTTNSDDVSLFSSVGPTIDGRMKPDISAPGSEVVSAYHTADNAYRSLDGTSMACPHVAGLTAILLAYNPELDFDQVKRYIFEGAERKLPSTNRECDGVGDMVFPNHHFGRGRINAVNSLRGLIQSRHLQ